MTETAPPLIFPAIGSITPHKIIEQPPPLKEGATEAEQARHKTEADFAAKHAHLTAHVQLLPPRESRKLRREFLSLAADRERRGILKLEDWTDADSDALIEWNRRMVAAAVVRVDGLGIEGNDAPRGEALADLLEMSRFLANTAWLAMETQRVSAKQSER